MDILVKSIDNYGENYSNKFKIIVKKFEILKKEYEYRDEFGNCRLVIKSDMLEIYRNGQINSKQILKLNKKTSFLYMTKEFKGKYEIFTKKLEIKNNEILVEYDIINNDEIINSIKLEFNFISK